MGDDKLSLIILNKKIYSSIELNINKEKNKIKKLNYNYNKIFL